MSRRNPAPPLTPAETIERLERELGVERSRRVTAQQEVTRLLKVNDLLRDLARAQAAALLDPATAIARPEIPW